MLTFTLACCGFSLAYLIGYIAHHVAPRRS